MKRLTTALGAVVAASVFGASATGLQAQETMIDEKLSLEIRGGTSLPASDDGGFRETVSPGGSFGIGGSVRVHPRVSLRLDGDWEFLPGDDTPASGAFPDQDLLHYNGGVEVDVLPRNVRPWSVRANLGLGATTWMTGEFQDGATQSDINETYFTLNGGVKLGYDLSSRFNLFAGFQAYRAFTDEEDSAVFNSVRPDVEFFDSVWTFPFQVGLRLNY